MRRARAAALALLVSAAPAAAAAAEAAYPQRPIRLIVPYPPGGANDIIGRLLAAHLSPALGQQVVVDNRPGSAGNLGAGLLARSSPDGYTMMIGGAGTLTVNPSLYSSLPFDTLKDFAPVSLIATLPLMLVVHPSLPVRTVRDLIAAAKANPGGLNFASPGSGTPAHLAGELFSRMAGIRMTHVPYKGGATALNDLLAGRVPMMFDNMPVTLPHVRAGKLHGLAVTSLKRSSTVPDLPTVAEAGLPGFEIIGWWGLVTRAGTPAPVVHRLSAEVQRIVTQTDARARLESQGFEPRGTTAEAFAQHLRAEIKKWAVVVRESGAKAD